MDFIKGMDISTLPEMLNLGFVYRDETGSPVDPFQLLKDNGVNSIRLRIWNEPENEPKSGGYCNLADTIKMAKKVKEHGMSLFLDFHYSDWWADPGQQRKPKAWENLTFPQLVQAVHDFTYMVLTELERAGAYPDFVQIGNEIRSGMLFPDGDVRNFAQLAELVNAGIRAVRELDALHEQRSRAAGELDALHEQGSRAAGELDALHEQGSCAAGGWNSLQERSNRIPRVKLVIHLDQGGRYQYFENWFDQALAHGLTDFDIIGLSYYPFWHGTFAEFRSCLERLIRRYKKPVMAAETAHAWRMVKDGFVSEQQERISGFPASPSGQRRVIELIMNIVASQKDGMGLGVYYWEPLDIPRPGIDGWPSNMGIMTPGVQPMEAIKAFHFVPDPARNKEPVKVVGVGAQNESKTGMQEQEVFTVVSDRWSMLEDCGNGVRVTADADAEEAKAAGSLIQTLAERLQTSGGSIRVSDPEFRSILATIAAPESVKVLYFDGTTAEEAAIWNRIELVNFTGRQNEALQTDTASVQKAEGKQPSSADRQGKENIRLQLSGSLPGKRLSFRYTILCENELTVETNYLPQGSFAQDFTGWELEAADVETGIITDNGQEGAAAENIFRFESNSNFTLQLHTLVTLPEPGRYRLSLQYFGTNTTGVEVNMYAQNENHQPQPKRYVEWIYPTDAEWQEYEIAGIEVTEPDSRIQIGLEAKCPPVYGMVRGIKLTKAEKH